MQALLAGGADPQVRNDRGQTALHLAAAFGHTRACQLLLTAHPALLMLPDRGGRTPLHAAVIYGNYSTARTLLATVPPGAEREALINARDGWGWTVLHWVVYQRKVRFARFLLGGGARPDQPDRRGRTPRSLARKSGNGDLLRLFQPSPR